MSLNESGVAQYAMVNTTTRDGILGKSAETGTMGKCNKSKGKMRCAGEEAATGNTASVHGSTRRRQLGRS